MEKLKEEKCAICGVNPSEDVCEACVAAEKEAWEETKNEHSAIMGEGIPGSENLYDKRKEWLEMHGVNIWEVQTDEEGNEFIWQEYTTMDEGESEDSGRYKLLVPENLTKDNVFKKHA